MILDRPIHPACAQWPRPSDADVREIAASIKAHGLINPIWLMPDGAILDGKTRYECCQTAGVEPRFETYTGDQPEKFTIAQNKARRHMSKGALSLIVAELAKLPRGRRQSNVPARTFDPEDKTMAELADAAGLGRQTIIDAKALLQNAEPNIIEMVRAEQVGVRSAAAYAEATPREQQRSADAKTVKDQGYAKRIGKGRASVKKTSPQTPSTDQPEITVSIHVLIEKLVPLFERVKVQSKKHIAQVSQSELLSIASEGRLLLDRWASGDETVRRARGHVVPFKRPTKRKGVS